jgi:predicted ATPase/transcriptional regulator with XRE-family HTH domain
LGLLEFRGLLKRILQQGGYSQQQLARALGIHPTLLSNKLVGVRKGRLNNPEIKHIIKILAEWELIFTRQEVLQLLAEVDLTAQLFNAKEWASPPLNNLTGDLTLPATGFFSPTTAATPKPSQPEKAETPAPSTGGSLAATRLPQGLTRLIGRDNLLDEVSDLLLQEDVRLVNLVGPGGIGKTRIGQAVAQRMFIQKRFKDGIRYIPLDTLTNPGLVAKALVEGLGLSEKKDNTPPLDQLIDFVAGQEMLLVVDNFEHLIEAAPALDHLLGYTTNLKLLVTSRVILGIYGEWVYSVPPLPLPESLQPLPLPETSPDTVQNQLTVLPSPDRLAATLAATLKNPAVTLFVERARAVDNHFSLNTQNVETVIRICRVLDGLPLAIELAAARTRLFELTTLAELLQQSYVAVLKIEARPDKWRIERHLSLQACLDWSYSLLEPKEKELFYRLGLFADEFNMETAQSILPAGATREDLYTGLDSLLSKSLIQVSEEPHSPEPGESPRRYRMLEPLREYGLEQLRHLPLNRGQARATGEESEERKVWRQYCFYWAGWVRREVERLYGPEVQLSYRRMQTEYANIVEALEWALQQGARREVLELAAELAFYWIWNTRYTEGTRYLNRVIALCQNPRPTDPIELSLLAKVLYGTGFIAVNQIEFKKAERVLQESQAIFRNLGDKVWLSRALGGLGFRATSQGEFRVGRVYLDESLALSRETGNEIRVAAALNNLGVVAIHLHEDTAAWDYCRECLGLSRKHENRIGQAMTLNLLGYVATNRQDFEEALACLEESRQIAVDLGNRESLNLTQNVLALSCYGQADFEAAAQHLNEGLRIAYEMGDRFGVLYNLSAQPAIALKLEGEPDPARLVWAARLLGATSALQTRSSGFALPRYRELFEESIAFVRANLAPALFEIEWNLGENMTLDEAVGMVLNPQELNES